MASPITFRSTLNVKAVLDSPAFRPPAAPSSLLPGPTAELRSAMARFGDGIDHTEQRSAVVALIDEFDLATITAIATRRTASHLTGPTLDAVSQIADTVPTEVLLDALGEALTMANRCATSVASRLWLAVRIATQSASVAGPDITEGTVVTLDLVESGLEFVFGAHCCPGRELAEAIVAGVQYSSP
jgi:hypothetical protein